MAVKLKKAATVARKKGRGPVVEIRILQRIPGSNLKRGDVLSVEEFKDTFDGYDKYTIDESWAFSPKKRDTFQLVVDGEDVTNPHSSDVKLTFGGSPVKINKKNDSVSCAGFDFDVEELAELIDGTEEAENIDTIGGKDVQLLVRVGCKTGTIAEIRAIVAAVRD